MPPNVSSRLGDDEFSPSYRPAPARLKHSVANFPRAEFINPSQFRTVVRHIANVHGVATPQELEAGRTWYPKVHEAVGKGVRGTGMSHWQGSGLVAALSPNMDFERTNIPAFKEVFGLKQHQWDAIHQSHAQPYGSVRTPEARDALKGLSISSIPDSNLVKAHRILQGEDPHDVMPRQTAPKTHSFASDIHDPEGSPHVTIDARAYDIGNNRMYPWTFSGRGISSADLPSSRNPTLKSGKPNSRFGQKTRYEHFEDAYRTAAQAVGEEHPTAMQAVTWTTGKRLEKQAPTKSGRPRQKGVARRGQPYMP